MPQTTASKTRRIDFQPSQETSIDIGIDPKALTFSGLCRAQQECQAGPGPPHRLLTKPFYGAVDPSTNKELNEETNRLIRGFALIVLGHPSSQPAVLYAVTPHDCRRADIGRLSSQPFELWLAETRMSRQRHWDLNICCGKTDGGGINADIVRHSPSIPNFFLIDDIYHLPCRHRRFKRIPCVPAIEHVEHPDRFDCELRRVGENVHYILPPLWDFGAAFNLLEHEWIFLTFEKEHTRLPRYTRLPFTRTLHRQYKQGIAA